MHLVSSRLASATIVAATITSTALAGGVDPEWTIITPANTGIPGDFTHFVYVDENDRPWVPGYIPFWEQGGMARWNEDGTWTTISNVDWPVIASPRFNEIVKDESGIMWIATYAGLLEYDPEVGPESLVRHDEFSSPIPGARIHDLALSPDNALWLAVGNLDSSQNGGLARLDLASRTWQVWTTDSGLPWGGEWPGWDWVHFVAAVPDADGGSAYTLWFGSENMGMATYRDGVFEWFGNDWWSQPPMTPRFLPSNDPVDDSSDLWIITSSGLALRRPSGEMQLIGYPDGLDTEVARVFAASGERGFLTTYHGAVYIWDQGWNSLGNWGGGHTYAFAEDSKGNFWTGGIGGAARLEDGSWQRYRLTNTGMLGYWLNTIDFDADGRVYMNGNAGPGVGGFTIYDGVEWICVNDFNYGLGPEWGLPSDDVQSLATRANGDVAIAPAGGQGLLNWNGETYTYLVPQFIGIEHVEEDPLGRLWAAREYGGGVYLIDDEGSQLFTTSGSPLPVGEVVGIIPDEGNPGFVWIAAPFGIAYTNGVEWDVYPREMLGLDQDTLGYHITALGVADDGTLWVGSGLGVFHFDPVTGEYVQYGLSETSLPSDDIQNITIAPDGSVWMTTFDHIWPYPGGLTRFDGEVWQTWTASDSPLPHNQVWELTSRAIAGGYEIWVGTASEGVAVVTLDTVPDVLGDIDGDGVVGFGDLLWVLTTWGPCPAPPAACPADLDGDGAVSFGDLLIVLTNWTG